MAQFPDILKWLHCDADAPSDSEIWRATCISIQALQQLIKERESNLSSEEKSISDQDTSDKKVKAKRKGKAKEKSTKSHKRSRGF